MNAVAEQIAESREWAEVGLGEGIALLSGCHVLAQFCNSDGHGVPYLTGPADFPEGRIQHTKFTTRPITMCEAGDILITVKGSGAGKLTRADARYCISRQLMAIRVSDWDSRFVEYALQASATIADAATGLIPGISRVDVLRTAIALPPFPEQQAIAAALSDADALIEGLESLSAKKRAIKQGVMQELLSGRRRLAGFSGEWTIKPLGYLARMKSGEGITSKDINDFSAVPCYGGNGLRGYTARFTHEGRYALIGRVGALCGNLNIVDGRFFASEHAIVATPADDVSVDWLALVLDQMRLNRFSEASAQPVLTVSKLEKLEIAVPPTKDEQIAIASIISDLTADLEALDARLAKARQIKQGMMQALLTGQVRLV